MGKPDGEPRIARISRMFGEEVLPTKYTDHRIKTTCAKKLGVFSRVSWAKQSAEWSAHTKLPRRTSLGEVAAVHLNRLGDWGQSPLPIILAASELARERVSNLRMIISYTRELPAAPAETFLVLPRSRNESARASPTKEISKIFQKSLDAISHFAPKGGSPDDVCIRTTT
jgi:hypothetical protein